MRLHTIKVTDESSESEMNRTVIRLQHLQKVNNYTVKQKPREEEAATRYYLFRTFYLGNQSINGAHVVIKNITKYHCQPNKLQN
jgi:hypothetical protein